MRKFTEAEDKAIVMCRQIGIHWGNIAAAVDRRTTVVQTRHTLLMDRERIPVTVCQRRACLTCGHGFTSTGAGHRMCDDCRAGADKVSPFEPDYGGASDMIAAAGA
jgi:hypothetical protein